MFMTFTALFRFVIWAAHKLPPSRSPWRGLDGGINLRLNLRSFIERRPHRHGKKVGHRRHGHDGDEELNGFAAQLLSGLIRGKVHADEGRNSGNYHCRSASEHPLRIVNRVYLKARKTASNARPVAMIVGQINCPGLSISARHKMTVIRLSRPKETFFPTFPTANR